MKAIFKKIVRLKKRRAIKNLIAAGATAYAVKYGRMNKTTDLFLNSSQEIHSITVQPSEALKSAFEIRGGDQHFWKFGPGSKARGAARGNGHKFKNSNINLFAEGWLSKNTNLQTHCQYYENAPRPCKPRVKAVDSPFYGDGNNPPPEGGNQDSSYYKGGPSPFKDFDYSNNDYTRQNVCFDDEKTMSHLYDRHARDCFGMQEPRNKESLERFKGKLRNYVESLKTDRINGSFRYEIPAFNFWDDSTDLVVTVDATTNKCVGLRNATDFQLDNLEKNGNIGFDSRPLMVLKLRGPKQ